MTLGDECVGCSSHSEITGYTGANLNADISTGLTMKTNNPSGYTETVAFTYETDYEYYPIFSYTFTQTPATSCKCLYVKSAANRPANPFKIP